MGSKYIEIFLFFFLSIYGTNSQENSELMKKNGIERYQTSSCKNYYGLFVMDNSEIGHETLFDQISIAQYYFFSSSLLNYSSSITITSQSNDYVNNNFTVVQPNDFSTMNKEISEILKQTVNGKTVSYKDFIFQVLSLDFKNSLIYSPNPFILFFVNSEITDLSQIASFIKNIKSMNNDKINILGIAMDPQYMLQTAFLVGDMEKVYTYNSKEQIKFDDLNNWIYEQACLSSTIRTTTTTVKSTTTKSLVLPEPCNGYINIVIDANSLKLTNTQYQKQINLIEDHILPLWKKFDNISILLMYGKQTVEIKDYRHLSSINDAEKFINKYGQSAYDYKPIYITLFRLALDNPFASIINKMTTFVFFSYIDVIQIYQIQQYASKLENRGKLNMIIMGDEIEDSILNPLNLSNVTQWDYSDDQIEMIQNFFLSNIKCI